MLRLKHAAGRPEPAGVRWASYHDLQRPVLAACRRGRVSAGNPDAVRTQGATLSATSPLQPALAPIPTCR